MDPTIKPSAPQRTERSEVRGGGDERSGSGAKWSVSGAERQKRQKRQKWIRAAEAAEAAEVDQSGPERQKRQSEREANPSTHPTLIHSR